MSDPTGTARLRRSFLAEGHRRLAQIRSQTYAILVEHDMMAARNDPLAQFLPNPGHRLSAFTEWFERTTRYWLLGQNWWERFLQRALDSGAVAGSKLLGSPPHSLLLVPAVSRELYSRELAGIAAAMVQQVTRQVAASALIEQKPGPMYRAVLTAIRKVGNARMKAFVNSSTVQLHNLARLAIFREAGIRQVGIDAESLEPARPSRFGHHDHLVHDETRAERELRRAEEAFRRLQEQQRREVEREAQRAEEELRRQRELLRQEIQQRLSGEQAVAERTRQQAERELARARAEAQREIEQARERTAEREQEAREAWERVQAARTEARTAEGGSREPASERAAREAAREAGLETYPIIGAEQTFGLPIPLRLRKLGAELVNVLTAGDFKVCQICQDLADDGPYSLIDAQGLLPAHPNCRCAFIPAPQRDDEED